MTDPDHALLERPRFVMMIGTYCAGKSTWTEDYIQRAAEKNIQWCKVSFDTIVHARAHEKGIAPYDLMKSKEEYDKCTDISLNQLRTALKNGENIVFDTTNTLPEWRSQVLDIVKAAPMPYHKTGVCLHITHAEGEKRFYARNEALTHLPEEKKVPVERFERHYNDYKNAPEPSLDEGFDMLLHMPTEEYRNQKWTETLNNANAHRTER